MFVKTDFEIYNLDSFKAIYTGEGDQEDGSKEYYVIADDNAGTYEIFGAYKTQAAAAQAFESLAKAIAADPKIFRMPGENE